MIIGTVIGNVWATRKEESLNSHKLMVVQHVDPVDGEQKERFVAVDCVGAGVGERVLVTLGSAASNAIASASASDAPVDAVIVAIIDAVQI